MPVGLRVGLLQKPLQKDPRRVVFTLGIDDGADAEVRQRSDPVVPLLRLAIEDGEVDAAGDSAVPQHFHGPVLLQAAAQEQKTPAVQKVLQCRPDGAARGVVSLILNGRENQRVKVRQRVRDRAVELEQAGASYIAEDVKQVGRIILS